MYYKYSNFARRAFSRSATNPVQVVTKYWFPKHDPSISEYYFSTSIFLIFLSFFLSYFRCRQSYPRPSGTEFYLCVENWATLERNSQLCITFLGIAQPQSLFPHSCVSVCERFIYSQDRSTYFLQQNRQHRQSREYINCSQTHECGNWDWERAISFLEIFASNFRYWFSALYLTSACPACVHIFTVYKRLRFISVSFSLSHSSDWPPCVERPVLLCLQGTSMACWPPDRPREPTAVAPTSSPPLWRPGSSGPPPQVGRPAWAVLTGWRRRHRGERPSMWACATWRRPGLGPGRARLLTPTPLLSLTCMDRWRPGGLDSGHLLLQVGSQ